MAAAHQASDSGSPIHVAALVAYNGGAYNGFQLQANVPTVQGELETALALCVGIQLETGAAVPYRVVGSGRTDTGVHARGQVIATQLPWRHDLAVLMRAWNAHLPADIVIRRLVEASPDFHPRFSALSRTYRYTVTTTSPQGLAQTASQGNVNSEERLPRSPLTASTAFHEPRMLDLTAMNLAAALLVGEHDFATFGRPPQGVNTVRTVFQADWQEVRTNLPELGGRGQHTPQRCLVFTICANAFLQRMVRNLVGTMVEVGLGQRTPEDVAVALAAKERSRSASPALPNGLILEVVDYPEKVDPFL